MYSNPNRYTTPMNLIFWLLTLAAFAAGRGRGEETILP